MAVKVSTWVWDKCKHLSGSDLLFMLALADKSNDEEGACYPGMNRLAEMCRIKSIRSLQKISARLQEKGHIGVVLGDGMKTKSGNTNKYYLNGYRISVGLEPIYTGNHPLSIENKSRSEFVHNPTGSKDKKQEVSTQTPDEVSSETGHEVSTQTPKPSVEPSVEQSVDKLQNKPKEKKQDDWYDSIKKVFGFTGALNGMYKKFLTGQVVKSKQFTGIALEKPLTAHTELLSWYEDYKRQYPNLTVVSNPAKLQSSITNWQDRRKPVAAPAMMHSDSQLQDRILDLMGE